MQLDLDTGRFIVFVFGLLLFLGIERIRPNRTPNTGSFNRLWFHALIATFNTTLMRVLIYVPVLAWLVYVEQMGWGLSRWLGLTGWVEFLFSIIVLDAFDYVWHRANHRFSFLWRFHKAHHSDVDIDVTTALRFHPGELLLSTFAKVIWVFLWGPSTIAWFLFEALVSFCAQWHHSNIDLSDKAESFVSKFVVTPRFHATHHLVPRAYGNANFSTIFSIWDLLFGSLAERLNQGRIMGFELGLPQDRGQAMSLKTWFLEPFSNSNLKLDDSDKSG
jgi:sterol desaturase/sphingolipid hydroxylase (fatty acid hydroxylase superfamily)